MTALEELNLGLEQNASAIYEKAQNVRPETAITRVHLVNGALDESISSGFNNDNLSVWLLVNSGEPHPSVTTLEYGQGSPEIPSLLEVTYLGFYGFSNSLDQLRPIWPPEVVGQKLDDGRAMAINRAIGNLLATGDTAEREQ